MRSLFATAGVSYSKILTRLGVDGLGEESKPVGDVTGEDDEEVEPFDDRSLIFEFSLTMQGGGERSMFGDTFEGNSLSTEVHVLSMAVGDPCLDPTFLNPQQSRFKMGR